MVDGHKRKDWRETESLDDAARRLWRDWDERKAKKAAEGLERSAQIADQQPTRSLVGLAEKCGRDSEREHESKALKLPGRQFTPPGEDSGDPVAEMGRSNGIGNTGRQADFGRGSSLKYKDTARPNSERTSLFTDRTDLEGPMLRRIE